MMAELGLDLLFAKFVSKDYMTWWLVIFSEGMFAQTSGVGGDVEVLFVIGGWRVHS